MTFIKKHLVALIILLIVASLICAAIFVLLQPQPAYTPAPKESPGAAKEAPSVTQEEPKETAGKYVTYSEATFQKTTGTRLLFFHAPWCPQCRELDTSIKASTLPKNTTIFKVDYDSHQALRQKYEVTLQTTLVKVAVDGSKQQSFVAYDTPTFNAVKEALDL